MTRPSRILLVDDEMSIQRTVAPLLRSRGYEVEGAATGRLALDALDANRPDLVILDLGLPDMDGLEVLRRLRHRNNKTPVLILTARDAIDDRVAGLNLG